MVKVRRCILTWMYILILIVVELRVNELRIRICIGDGDAMTGEVEELLY